MFRILALTKENKTISELKKNLLEQSEIELISFTNTLDLLDSFQNFYSNLVILDIDLLKDEVTKMIKLLRSTKSEFKVVLILSSENMQFCSNALSLGVVSYLIKPISISNIVEIIYSALNIKMRSNQD